MARSEAHAVYVFSITCFSSLSFDAKPGFAVVAHILAVFSK